MELMMTPLEYRAYTVFDERIHEMDIVAKQYLESASADMHHLIPVDVPTDGNCLYHSVLISKNNSTVTTSELRVRTIVELITNETFYSNMYANVVGPIDIAVKGVCKNFTYSELYEICALCTVLGCNIRSVYPETNFHCGMAVMNNIFTPAPSVAANSEITILWSHAWDEIHARAVNNNVWSPNHFVPLMSPSMPHESDRSNELILNHKTPEKQKLKNNTPIQIRIPEFQDSPNRRFRADNNVITDFTESISLKTRQQNYNKGKTQQETRLEQERNRHRIRRANQTEEEHQI
ncbi:unnamed protein product [Adineta steineri]|uniref:Vertnin n=1 Tax=Adineta steineri TaxID=433720 RepID=A0A815USM6_9BILA|nr:unnamed protein product [Adineta steineri]CAF4185773.1 unnamed protein product [Adineta steineri]